MTSDLATDDESNQTKQKHRRTQQFIFSDKDSNQDSCGDDEEPNIPAPVMPKNLTCVPHPQGRYATCIYGIFGWVLQTSEPERLNPEAPLGQSRRRGAPAEHLDIFESGERGRSCGRGSFCDTVDIRVAAFLPATPVVLRCSPHQQRRWLPSAMLLQLRSFQWCHLKGLYRQHDC